MQYFRFFPARHFFKLFIFQQIIPDELADNLDKATISVNSYYADDPLMRDIILGDLAVKYNDRQYMVPIIDPGSNLAEVFARAVMSIRDDNVPADQAERKIEPDLFRAFAKDTDKSATGEPAAQHPDDPALKAIDAFVKDTSKWPSSEPLDPLPILRRAIDAVERHPGIRSTTELLERLRAS